MLINLTLWKIEILWEQLKCGKNYISLLIKGTIGL